MSLSNDLLKIYDNYHMDESYASKMVPVGFCLKKMDVEVRLNIDGDLVDFVQRPKDQDWTTLTPATVESVYRSSSKSAPFPVFDQVKYLANGFGKTYHEDYMSLLEDLVKESDYPPLKAVYRYLCKGKLEDDLGVWKDFGDKTPKLNLRFCVIGSQVPKFWEDPVFVDAWQTYLAAHMEKQEGIDWVSGESRNDLIRKHPKVLGNAKLYSSNDSEEYTFRGNVFTDPNQLPQISFKSSQKIHSALRWLLDTHAIRLSSDKERYLIVFDQENKRTNELVSALFGDSKISMTDYFSSTLETLNFGKVSKIPTSILIVDKTTSSTGRLSIVDYRKIDTDAFYQSIADWHHRCRFGTFSPSLKQIVSCAYGTEIEKKGKTILSVDGQMFTQQLTRLFECVLKGQSIPSDIQKRLIRNASTPYRFQSDSKTGRRYHWERTMDVACAVINQSKGGDMMKLDHTCTDRSYLWGRLLAISEKMEVDTYDANQKGRVPSAIRFWDAYRQRPLATYETIKRKLIPYSNVLRSKEHLVFYDQIISEIFSLLPDGDQNKPLGENYLLGYRLQKNELYAKKEEHK